MFFRLTNIEKKTVICDDKTWRQNMVDDFLYFGSRPFTNWMVDLESKDAHLDGHEPILWSFFFWKNVNENKNTWSTAYTYALEKIFFQFVWCKYPLKFHSKLSIEHWVGLNISSESFCYVCNLVLNRKFPKFIVTSSKQKEIRNKKQKQFPMFVYQQKVSRRSDHFEYSSSKWQK